MRVVPPADRVCPRYVLGATLRVESYLKAVRGLGVLRRDVEDLLGEAATGSNGV